uniref:Macaca fascicularis brain cDNA, clone: QflA-19968 n=1 Tax=Macaca fascicularis TaxID=9541 RepID=I7GIH8_MACFA|nr:unnamed protein product [Macaca fascicularis]
MWTHIAERTMYIILQNEIEGS